MRSLRMLLLLCFDLRLVRWSMQVMSIGFVLSIIAAGFLQAQLKVVGYVTNHQLAVVDYNRITHLNIAFENPDDMGNLSYTSVNTTYIQQAHAKGKKVLVSIGGGLASFDPVVKARYFNLINDENRAAFVSKIVSYLNYHGFDGIDVDLEGASINSDYGKFVRDLRNALNPQKKLVTAALSHANGGDNVADDTILLFDFLNIMAYDATGPWNPDIPGQHSSFEFAVASLDYWIKRGLPKSKAILGVPFYGYGFGADFNEGISYSMLVKNYPGAEDRDVSGNTIYYNGAGTINQKAAYVLENGYGGIMIWQLAQDASGDKSLLKIIDNVLNPVTAMDEGELQNMQLFPNPVESTLSLSAFGFQKGEWAIIDSAGVEYSIVKKTDDLIDVSGLRSGIYIIKFRMGEAVIYKKFVKQ